MTVVLIIVGYVIMGLIACGVVIVHDAKDEYDNLMTVYGKVDGEDFIKSYLECMDEDEFIPLILVFIFWPLFAIAYFIGLVVVNLIKGMISIFVIKRGEKNDRSKS